MAAGHAAAAAAERVAEAGARHHGAAARVAAARLRATRLAEEHSAATAVVAGWNAVATVDAARHARRRVVSLEEQLTAATAEAAPLRARLDETAAGYAHALDASIAALDARVAALDAEVAQAREAERAARTAAQEASEQRGALAGELTAVTQALAGLEADLTAVAGHLDHAPAAAIDAPAVEDAIARNEGLDADAADEIERLTAERAMLRERRAELAASADSVGAARRAAERTAESTGARAEELRARVDELAVDERLRALAGGADVDPVAEAVDLAALLTAAVSRAERGRVELAVADADDERALATLGADRLLPAALDVVRAVDVLDRAGIPVTTGWRYLADSVPPERRAELMTVAPALAGGLLVHEERDLPAARAALTASGLRPTSPVVLATTRDLDRAAGTDVGAWLLPPAAALTDRAAAGAEIDRREAARAHRARADAELVAQRDADADRRRRLDQLRADCPPGTLAALDAAAAEAAEAVATADTDLARIAADVAALGAREADAETRRGELERARRSAAAAIATLSALLPRVRDAADRRARAAELPARIAARGAEVERATAAESQARTAAGAAADQVVAVRRALTEQRDLRASLPDPGPGTAAMSIDDARRAFESADQAYRREVSESSLAVALEEARRALAAPAARVAGLRADVRARAEALLDGPDGADPATRDAAAARAQGVAEQLTSATGELRAEQRDADAELAAHPAPAGSEEPDVAADPAELDAVRTRALDAATEAAARASELLAARSAAEDSARDAEALRSNARERSTGLTHLLELLRVDPGTCDDPAEVGSLDDAHAAVTAARAAVDAALAQAREASTTVEDVARRIVVWAAADRFAAVKPDVRDRFRVADVAGELAPVADTLAADLAVYAVNLRERLTDLEEDKGVVVTAMTGMVRQALRSLSRAQSLSELPGTLGEWAGQRFLEVGPRASVETADAVVRDRCSRLVDSLTSRGAEVPRGLELLWQATDAVVGDGNWKARVLKPSTTFAVERVSVERMRKWSGGEKVTISLLLFCMVAKLRATSRGRDVPGLGALPLDNPLGKANYVVFLDLQRKVAAANGVQLIFLTGVGDLKAVGRFPNIIRMRNVAGGPSASTRGRQYVRQEERILADADPSDAIDTTRVWREDPVLTLM
ncbi:exonuclease SbcC [Pseudonocardia sp. N23]|nr:exonuclease SbcC [Pseudonocardia sp. N23]